MNVGQWGVVPPPRLRRNFTDEARGGGQRPHSRMISILACRTFTVHGAKAHFLFLPLADKGLFDAEILENTRDHGVY